MSKLCANIEPLTPEEHETLINKMRTVLMNAIDEDTVLHVSWSGGKDSTATVILLHDLGVSNVKITTVDIMYDDETPAIPEIHQFKHEAAKVFESWGYEVEFVKHPSKTYVSEYLHVITRSKKPERNGKIQGAPIMGMCRFTGLKQNLIKQVNKKYTNAIEVIGIASDEVQRFNRKHFTEGNKTSILAITDTTEAMALDLCRKHNMLSPLYDMDFKRDGCFFCPYSSAKQIAYRATKNPEVFKKWRDFLLDNLNIPHSSYTTSGKPHFNTKLDTEDVINIITEALERK